jgi:signal transduction histidine kinase
MDLRIVARKVFIYFVMSIAVYGVFKGLVWIYSDLLGGLQSNYSYVAGIFLAPAFVFFFYSLDRGTRNFANKYLFFSLYNYQETINKLTDDLNHYIDLDKIINLIVDTIKKTMQLDRTGILLINSDKKPVEYQIAKVIGFNRSNGISLVKDNFLTRYLEKHQKPLVRDEIILLARDSADSKERNGFMRLHKHMKKIEASLCLPIMSSKKLIGIIVLGPKISGDAYTHEDLNLLNTLSKQAGTAIDNAQLYKKIEEFNHTLKQKVDDQTRNLQEANRELMFQNKLNKELLEMKSDFLRVVNHQLNTPLSVMSGYFSMLKEGSYKASQALPAIEQGLKRINQTVSDFWDAYEIEGERMRMEPQKVDITGIVDKLIAEKKDLPLAQKRKLKIKVKKADFKIPLVWCDQKKLTHVISNLLDNAVFYTDKGSITVIYEKAGDDYLKINVKDTGAGISKEDSKKLFQKFSRGQRASGLHPDGSGLGLYIARKIVESNNGELNFTSQGEGKGTTFSFTLPVYRNQKSAVPSGDEVYRGKKIEIF